LIIDAFIRSIASTAEDLSDADVIAFLKRRPTRREDPKERAVLRRFLVHLRAEGVCSPTKSGLVTPADEITRNDMWRSLGRIVVWREFDRDLRAVRSRFSRTASTPDPASSPSVRRAHRIMPRQPQADMSRSV
jgi:hypothetical protein